MKVYCKLWFEGESKPIISIVTGERQVKLKLNEKTIFVDFDFIFSRAWGGQSSSKTSILPLNKPVVGWESLIPGDMFQRSPTS